MKKILLALMLTPLFAAAENYFVEGAKWTMYYLGDTYPATYTLEGTEFRAGYECHNLYCTSPKGARILITMIRTEGDKVYYLHDPYETEWDLLYDFGLEEGEEADMAWLYEWVYSKWPDSFVKAFTREELQRRVVCTKKTTMPEYGGANVLFIEDADAVGEPLKVTYNCWVDGVGYLQNMVRNCGYHHDSVSASAICAFFEVDGEEIVRYNHFAEPEGSAFYPGVIWKMDVDGYKGEGRLYEDFFVAAYPYYTRNGADPGTYSLYKPVKDSETGYGMKFASRINVGPDRVYRLSIKDCPGGLAYDFAMQPGDVRKVIALEATAGTPHTWVKCTERSASKTFPGRDEIQLDEYADADCTELIGHGMWVTGIGSPASPLANSRFAETSAGSQLKMVSQFDKVMWDRERFGAPTLANLETVKAEDGAATGAVFYNLQGMRVDNPGNGMFIRVEGGKTSKVLLK